jgi:hypothetical protein
MNPTATALDDMHGAVYRWMQYKDRLSSPHLGEFPDLLAPCYHEYREGAAQLFGVCQPSAVTGSTDLQRYGNDLPENRPLRGSSGFS